MPWIWIANYGNSCCGTWFDIIQNRSHSKIKSFQIHSNIKQIISKQQTFGLTFSISKWSKKDKAQFEQKIIKRNFFLISLALFPIKWFWNTDFFGSNECKVNFLRMKLKVAFKAFNIVQDWTALKTTLKCYQDSEAVVQRCSVKKVFFMISQNLQKTPVPGSHF